MTRNIIKKQPILLTLAGLLFLLGACLKDDLEVPKPKEIPVGTVITIDDLRNLFQGEKIKFDTDISIHGVITMDGSSGNIYREAYIQDATGAINLRIQSPGGLYQGDSVRVNLRNTILGSYQQMLQLDSVHVDNNVTKLATLVAVEPLLLDIPNLLASGPAQYQGRLVKLENVQFDKAELGKTFANKEKQLAESRMLADCQGSQVIVRTSGYAKFADQQVPQGNGTFIGILTQYGRDMQLYIRDMSEIQMNEERCPTPGESMNPVSVAFIKNLFNMGYTNIPPNSRLEGVIISDRAHSNHPGQNAYLVDENGDGIALRFGGFHDLPLGQKVRILVGGLPLERFNGLLQLNNIPLGNAYKLEMADVPEPVTATIANIQNNFDLYESRLVKILNVTIPPSGTFNGNIGVSDGTGNANIYTYNWASFANTPVQPGKYNITVIVSKFNSVQLLLRSLDDMELLEIYDPGQPEILTIAQVRQLHKDGANTMPVNTLIEAIITSDYQSGNLTGRNAMAQDASGRGIALRFSANHPYKVGDKISIQTGGLELSRFNGLLQINNIPLASTTVVAANQTITPTVVTITELLANLDTYESTLVRINNVNITGGSTFQGERTLNDGTGSIMLFTRNDANFASSAVPAETVAVVGNVSIFNSPQIIMRNINDIIK